MPGPLRAYIAGVVTLSAIALVAATYLFPAGFGIALTLSASTFLGGGAALAQPTELQILAGIVFWTALTLLASALPVRLPFGSHQAVAMAPIVAAMTLGGPAVGGWVAALGTTEMRELRGRIPWYGTLANHAGAVLPAIVGGVVQLAVLGAISLPREWLLVESFLAAIVGAGVFYGLNLAIAAGVLSLRTNQSFRLVFFGDSRVTVYNSLALAPLGWLMSIVYSLAWWATLLFALPLLHDAAGLAAVRRDARHVHADDRRLGRGRRQARSVHGAAQPAGQGDRGRHRAGHAGQRSRAGGARVGRPAPRRRQDRRPGRRPAEAGAAHPGRADDHELAPGPRRRRSSRRSPSSRRSCRSSATTTSGTTARATRTGSSATRSRSSPGSSTSPMPSRP